MKRALIAGLAAVLAFAPMLLGASAAPVRRPNVILILADDLGYGELSGYGQRRYRTPHLDRLAGEGVRFTQYYAGSPVCAPSRDALLTGRHTGHATVRGNAVAGTGAGGAKARVGLARDDVTVARRFQEAGYATALVGKWGLGEPGSGSEPWHHGFGFFYGFLNQAHAHNQYPEFLYRGAVPEPLEGNFSHGEREFANDRFTDEALAFIGRHPAQPFFLYLAYTTPHAELKVPADSVAALRAQEEWARLPGADPASVTFAAMMLRLDRDVGRLLARLDELGLARDTIVVFTSDNGPHEEDGKDNAFFAATSGLRGVKRDVHEGGIRVPCLVRWPGRIVEGRTSDLPCAAWDLSGTLLELAGLPVAGWPADGVSLVPTLSDRAAEQRRHDFLYWELRVRDEGRQALRQGDWKLVRARPDAPAELYDLRSDPGETQDLASRHPETAARLTALLTLARTESPDFPLAVPTRAVRDSSP